jgi:hypothetical protein
LFVRTIDLPAANDAVSVTVGYERTPFAQQTFGDVSDLELLRKRGPTEEEIQRLWTLRSINIARVSLFASYLLFLCSLIAACSLVVLYEVMGPPTAP